MIETLNFLSDRLLDMLQVMNLQHSIFLLGVLGLLTLLKGHDARILYLITLIALAKLLLPPFMIWTPSFSPDNAGLTKLDMLLRINSSTPWPVSEATSLSLQSLIVCAWFVFAGVMFGTPIVRTCLLRRKFNPVQAISLEPELASFEGSKIQFLKSELSHSPLVFGFFKHRVILPRDWDEWSLDCKRIVLAHELAHIRAHDNWVSFLQLLAKVIYFFNPLFFILNRRLNQYREMARDDTAVSSINVSPVDYSKQLVRISELLVQQKYCFVSLSSFSHPKSDVKSRISYQLGAVPRKRSGLKSHLILALLLVLCVPFSIHFADRGHLACGVKNARAEGLASGLTPALLQAKAEPISGSDVYNGTYDSHLVDASCDGSWYLASGNKK